MKKRLLCFLMKNNHVYNVGDDNIFKQDRNCYIVTKYGSMVRPIIFYDKRCNGALIVEQELIGDFKDLIYFLSDKSNSKVYLRGFSRAIIGEILGLVIKKRTIIEKQKDFILASSNRLTQECRIIANYIIEEINKYNQGKQFREQISMHARKLQKLLYLCDIEHMREYDGTPMFNDEFYAWPSGPVIPEIYYKYTCTQTQYGEMKPLDDTVAISMTQEMKSIVDRVLAKIKESDTLDIEAICKINNGPWAQAFDTNDEEHNQIISKESMYNYYRENKKKIRKKII